MRLLRLIHGSRVGDIPESSPEIKWKVSHTPWTRATNRYTGMQRQRQQNPLWNKNTAEYDTFNYFLQEIMVDSKDILN